MMNVGRQVFGAAAIFLGVIGVVSGDFALVWQPVPPGLPARSVFAVATGLLLIIGGALACSRRRAALGGAILGVLYALCVVLLHVPDVFARPTSVNAYAGVAEQLSLVCGGVLVYAAYGRLEEMLRRRLIHAALIAYAVCLLMFGFVHFYYSSETAAYVPAWLPPGQLFWAYATGVGHIAAGVALILGLWTRVAMRLLVLMFVSFSVFVHLPLLLADAHSHLSWVMNAMNLCLTGAAWVVLDQTASLNPSFVSDKVARSELATR
jgi:uncharacterized membrane protein YphA (DoxX/SURF4 family)